jgi:hypothetical protein
LCETVKQLVAKVGHQAKDGHEEEGSISNKCSVLNEKLDALLQALKVESKATEPQDSPESEIVTTTAVIESSFKLEKATTIFFMQ